ncbi:MAG: DUF2255 family protein [Candidatus Nanopelagicales bacterium]
MTTWPTEQLLVIASADDLHISPLRPDGVTYGTPTWIWSVAVEGELYVRAYNGVNSSWYQAALAQPNGRIATGGTVHPVEFEPVRGPINDRIDEAYRAKYANSPYLSPMIGSRAREATIRVRPIAVSVQPE